MRAILTVILATVYNASLAIQIALYEIKLLILGGEANEQ